MPYSNSFCKLGLCVPGSEQKDDDWGESRFEETDHEAEGIHLLAVLCCGLGKSVVSTFNGGFAKRKAGRTYVNAVQPSSQATRQMRGLSFSAIMFEGICMMANAMV